MSMNSPSITDGPLPRAAAISRAILKALPDGALALLGRGGPVNQAGDRLAPEIAGALRVLNALPGSDFSDKSAQLARESLQAEALIFADTFDEFALVEDIVIPSDHGGIPATHYRATHAQSPAVIVYFHGGGWVLGDRRTTDSAVRFLAVKTGADVLSIDYRLAPEARFPGGLEDALTAYAYVVEHCGDWGISPDRIIVAGDSAGANLAAVLSQQVRGDEHPPMLQVLISPALDLANEADSYDEFADGFMLTRKHMHWYREHYLAYPEQASDPRVSPILEPDLTGLAPSYIGVAGFDPLRDEGLAYGELLRAAGNEVTVKWNRDVIHPYINVTGFSSAARRAAEHLTDHINATIARA